MERTTVMNLWMTFWCCVAAMLINLGITSAVDSFKHPELTRTQVVMRGDQTFFWNFDLVTIPIDRVIYEDILPIWCVSEEQIKVLFEQKYWQQIDVDLGNAGTRYDTYIGGTRWVRDSIFLISVTSAPMSHTQVDTSDHGIVFKDCVYEGYVKVRVCDFSGMGYRTKK